VPKKKGSTKRYRFNQQQLNVVPEGKSLAKKHKLSQKEVKSYAKKKKFSQEM